MGDADTTVSQTLASWPWRWIAAGALVVGVLVAYVLLALSSGATAAAGTTVEGVDVGGLTRSEAIAEVERELGPLVDKKIKAHAGETTFTVKPAEAGLALDAAASVDPAFAPTWNPLVLVGRMVGAGPKLAAVVTIDDTKMAERLDSMAQGVDRAVVEPGVEVRHGKVRTTAGEPGLTLDRDQARAALAQAALTTRAPIDLAVTQVAPSITQAAIDRAREIATTAMVAPVVVTAGPVTAKIPAKAIGRALSFSAEGGVLAPQLDGAILHRAIADDLAELEVNGRDATFKLRNGQVKIVKSRPGRGVSDEELATAVAGVIDAPAGERRVSVAIGERPAHLTTAMARALGVTDRISSFTQPFPYAAYRTQNIGQAAKRINGTVLQPGEVFSLNDTIKERTRKNGYTVGFVVGEGGVFDEALGGGVSTSATATWTAAFFAGMERVQTIAHSIYISRYAPGLEATVAWGIFDLKFRNPYDKPVFITSSSTGTSITVSFWGTPVYSDIKAEFGARRAIVPYETIHDTSKTCRGQNGVDGFTITVDRVFYVDGKESRREPITTRYKPAPDVVCGPEKDKPGKNDKPDQDGKPSTGSASPSSTKPGKPKPTATPKPTASDVFSND